MRRGAAWRGAVRCGAVRRGPARCGAVRRLLGECRRRRAVRLLLGGHSLALAIAKVLARSCLDLAVAPGGRSAPPCALPAPDLQTKLEQQQRHPRLVKVRAKARARAKGGQSWSSSSAPPLAGPGPRPGAAVWGGVGVESQVSGAGVRGAGVRDGGVHACVHASAHGARCEPVHPRAHLRREAHPRGQVLSAAQLRDRQRWPGDRQRGKALGHRQPGGQADTQAVPPLPAQAHPLVAHAHALAPRLPGPRVVVRFLRLLEAPPLLEHHCGPVGSLLCEQRDARRLLSRRLPRRLALAVSHRRPPRCPLDRGASRRIERHPPRRAHNVQDLLGRSEHRFARVARCPARLARGLARLPRRAAESLARLLGSRSW